LGTAKKDSQRAIERGGTRNIWNAWTQHREQKSKNQRLTYCLLLCSDYINIRTPVYLSHSAGKYAVKRFRKAQCPVIERLTNALMMNGRNNGKKLMAVRIVAHAFEIVRLSSYTPRQDQQCYAHQ